jgi:hypothetical protein
MPREPRTKLIVDFDRESDQLFDPQLILALRNLMLESNQRAR